MRGAVNVDRAFCLVWLAWMWTSGGVAAMRELLQTQRSAFVHQPHNTCLEGSSSRAACILCFLFMISMIGIVAGWQRWDPFVPEGQTMEDAISPHGRSGHSLHLWNNSVYVFGGRSDDILDEHIPRTYAIVMINGTLQFSTYDKKPVKDCNLNDTENCDHVIPLGVYHNDILEYPLDCVRWSDLGCQTEGWKIIDPGAILGGCKITGSVESCTHPTERFEHMSTIWPETGELFVYGGFSQRCEDFCSDVWTFPIATCKANRGACKWRQIDQLGRRGPGKRWRGSPFVHFGQKRFFFYGGHRIWQGFGETNSVENKWADTYQYPSGGYMDDMWRYDRDLNAWDEMPRRQSCYPNPGVEWKDRFNVRCVVYWPPARANAQFLLYNGTLLLHGGYRTFFPYPQSNGRGAGRGTAELGSDGFTPYPSYPYYLDDMWIYEISTGYWTERKPLSTVNPMGRAEHSIVLIGNVLLMFGGYRSNVYFNDLWFYNLTTDKWIEKDTYVWALYPKNCTSDVAFVNNRETQLSQSVFGQPTRFTALDGAYGRATDDVFILQARRRAPGWDGCRDRIDERADLPAQLQWWAPSQRAAHRAIYSPKHRAMLVYGGRALVNEQVENYDITHPTHTATDFWQHHIDHCAANCSLHGSCFHGYCFCDEGFYGVDCSNISCPGDWCYYDENHQQVCKHCCHAAFTHVDGQGYVQDERKIPCSMDYPGETHGICDGFGQCQCAPPYITRDCSVRDCPRNCSGHGWCNLEYPVSRCMCDPTWIGEDCSQLTCLNNCTYPNGVCLSNGKCNCSMTYNPYNKTLEWMPFAGIDCSYIVPFAAATRLAGLSFLVLASLLGVLVYLLQ